MRECRINERNLSLLKMNLILWMILAFTVLFAVLISLVDYLGIDQSWRIGIGLFWGCILSILGTFFFVRMKESWESQRVFLEEDRITSLETHKPAITVSKEMVASIQFRRKGIRIRTFDKNISLFIPKEIREYAFICLVMREWSEGNSIKLLNDRKSKWLHWQIRID